MQSPSAVALDQPRPSQALKARDYKTLALSALGGTLEFYDFVIFVFFTAVLGDLFFPPGIPGWLRQLQTFAIFAAGYLIRPLGGLVLAHFGDILGRKKMFVLSVMLMSIPTMAVGLLPTYAELGVAAPILLLLMRLLQGAAIGGEVPGAWVFVAEHVSRGRTGLACGTLTGGLTAGILLGSLVATAINAHFTPADVRDFGWRIPFLIGGVFGLVSVYLRRWLEETPVFDEIKRNKQLAKEMPVKTVLRQYRAQVAVSMLLTSLLAGAIIVIVLMMPILMQKSFHVDATTALVGSSIATFCLTLACAVAGMLADRFGQRRVLQVGCVLLAMTFYAFYRGISDPNASTTSWLTLYAITGTALGVIGVVPSAMVGVFPPEIRFTGISFSYNLAYAIFGGLTPIVISLWMAVDIMAPLYFLVAVCLVGAVTAAFLNRLSRP
ncbi:MFS transporter [Bordetella genomosp. 8]|uniref:MFS transporter n=1 Tax=Bordetella genomosp. 8 TaxID=1416806 RepID=A0A1W6YQ22_9BORD|nr:MFS transporter [Bordetella genomosp. 8]ARP83157.1 MFS transporter [Bordetella genomosp. 8]